MDFGQHFKNANAGVMYLIGGTSFLVTRADKVPHTIACISYRIIKFPFIYFSPFARPEVKRFSRAFSRFFFLFPRRSDDANRLFFFFFFLVNHRTRTRTRRVNISYVLFTAQSSAFLQLAKKNINFFQRIVYTPPIKYHSRNTFSFFFPPYLCKFNKTNNTLGLTATDERYAPKLCSPMYAGGCYPVTTTLRI